MIMHVYVYVDVYACEYTTIGTGHGKRRLNSKQLNSILAEYLYKSVERILQTIVLGKAFVITSLKQVQIITYMNKRG